jgi:hypothetical protein
MVAKIISGKSLSGLLNYNEHKVKLGTAELIGASGYHKEPQDLTFYDKLFRLEDLISHNPQVKTNAIHLILNFAPGENLDKQQLMEIAEEYTDRIGFINQPFLVYRHDDAGHPHIHIVTTNVRYTGERISLHNLGKTKSEAARQAIELKYGLVRASSRQPLTSHERLTKAVYGQCETKRAITSVVNEVIKIYKFTSIPELNAVLNQFNVAADRGSKESRMFAKNGLIYWIVNEKGEKKGVPIKASSIYGKPTLKNLEEIFRKKEQLRKPYKESLKKRLDLILVTRASEAGFQQALSSKGMQVIFRRNMEGRLYGVTYVDHLSKVVFNGSDLGKAYSAAALSERFRNSENLTPRSTPADTNTSLSPSKLKPVEFLPMVRRDTSQQSTLLTDLFRVDYDSLSPELLKKKKKRKRQL